MTVALVTTIIKASTSQDKTLFKGGEFAVRDINLVGDMILYSDQNKPNHIPPGWLECDGSELYVKQWPALADVVRDYFGGHPHPESRIFPTRRWSPSWGRVIPGYTSWWRRHGKFKLPDLRGRTLVGMDWGRGG